MRNRARKGRAIGMLAPNIDQATVLLSCHHWEHGLRYPKCSLEFVIDALREVLPGHLLKWRKPAAHCGIAHQDIQVPVGFDDLSDQSRDLLRVTHVCLDCARHPSRSLDLCHHPLSSLYIAEVVHNDTSATRGQ